MKFNFKDKLFFVVLVLFIFAVIWDASHFTGFIAKSEWCEDSDAKNYWALGTVSNSLGEMQIDYCTDMNYVVEWYCVGNDIKFEKSLCEDSCERGVCVEGKSLELCTDTDKGLDFYNVGIIETSSGEKMEDYCESNVILVEYYCLAEGTLAEKEYDCSFSNTFCDKGECLITKKLDSYVEPEIVESSVLDSYSLPNLEEDSEVNIVAKQPKRENSFTMALRKFFDFISF